MAIAASRLEEDYPLLFQKIKAQVASGEFQVLGGTWVEMDTNMPSGEGESRNVDLQRASTTYADFRLDGLDTALCRQFLYGQRFFKAKFGSYTRTFWLPDSFG